MADPTTSFRYVRRASPRGRPSMTERQLDAYLMARDVLRRLRHAGQRVPATPASRPPDHRA